MTPTVDALPYRWPWHGALEPGRTALVVHRHRRWRPGGVAPADPDRRLASLADALASAGGRVVVVTDVAAPGCGQAGGDQVTTAADRPPGAVEVPVPGVDGFFGSALHSVLRRLGVTDLLVAGWGLEGPVHSTLRSANDRGYECLLVPDACTAVDPDLVAGACSTVTMSGGIFGAHAPTAAVLAVLAALAAAPSPAAPPVLPGGVPGGVPAGGHQSDHVPPAGAPTGEKEAPVSTPIPDRPVFDRPGPVAAQPYPWPFDGALDPARTALVLIDWQVDFCGPGGYVDQMGYDLSLTRAGLAPTAVVLDRVRRWGATVIHTREGHRPDLSDCPDNKRWRSRRIGAGIGDAGPCGRILVRGEPGWEIVPEVAPIDGEPVVDKPGKGAFYATDLDLLLANRGITHLVLTGITTDVCVHTTMREANDRGYECLLLSDCTGATDVGNYEAALKMVTMQGGVFGAVAPSAAFLAALDGVAGRAA
ncbi:MAG TPA: isochorismatase family protein [Acidimicrobiales bacterium]|nr:isochorismatase family protein [Acidimicrobiales bacterium]